jgi:vacuolar-type H+-ATPase subunit I/STV1
MNANNKKKLLEEKIKRIVKENFVKDAVPGSDGKLGAYAAKVEKALDEIQEKLEDLAKEGEDLKETDLIKHAAVGQRNTIILTTIGVLRKLKELTINSTVDLRKKL